EDGDGIDMPFQFLREDVDVQNAGTGEPPEWSLSQLKGAVREWQQEYDGWIATCIGNHDQTRAVSQFGDEDYRVESATLLATFLLTLRGTPHVYQGEELGMTNVTFDSLAEIDDPETRNRVTAAIEAGEAESFEDLREVVNVESRDHARTPMQWDESDNAGFTDGEPWLKVNRNYRDVNARAARASDEGIWQFYRRLIERRHEMDVLVYGEFELLLPEDEEIYACVRTLGDERVLVVLNWTDESNTVPLEDRLDGASLLLSNYGSRAESLRMEPYEARLYRVQ
ncbi:MAG: alpha-amylase family glycosyl hydrolase, partial [Halapricum sp.]